MICGVEVFSQGARAGTLAAVGVISFREDDPGAPTYLVEVHMQVNSAAGRLFTPSFGRVRAPRRLFPVAAFAPAPPRPAGLSDFGRGQELGLFSRVEQAGFGLGVVVRASV